MHDLVIAGVDCLSITADGSRDWRDPERQAAQPKAGRRRRICGNRSEVQEMLSQERRQVETSFCTQVLTGFTSASQVC